MPRIRAKAWFLTYPQCPFPADVVQERLESLGDLEEFIIAHEEHQDEGIHIHVYALYADRVELSADGSTFDLDHHGTRIHGNYQVCKNKRKTIAYITKDGDFVSNIDVKSYLSKHGKKKFSADQLFDVPLSQLIEDDMVSPFNAPNFMRTRNHLIAEKSLQVAAAAAAEPPLPKKRHQWIFGPSNSGKTTHLRSLHAEWEKDHFEIPRNNDWVGYCGQRYLWMDEFKGDLSITELNRLCDGDTKVNVKGGSAYVPLNRTLYIVSNFSIEECFQKASPLQISTLKNRFEENEFFLDQQDRDE